MLRTADGAAYNSIVNIESNFKSIAIRLHSPLWLYNGSHFWTYDDPTPSIQDAVRKVTKSWVASWPGTSARTSPTVRLLNTVVSGLKP